MPQTRRQKGSRPDLSLHTGRKAKESLIHEMNGKRGGDVGENASMRVYRLVCDRQVLVSTRLAEVASQIIYLALSSTQNPSSISNSAPFSPNAASFLVFVQTPTHILFLSLLLNQPPKALTIYFPACKPQGKPVLASANGAHLFFAIL